MHPGRPRTPRLASNVISMFDNVNVVAAFPSLATLLLRHQRFPIDLFSLFTISFFSFFFIVVCPFQDEIFYVMDF